ncbi:hypothetical protein VMCG_01186 [Cytospora schulzeri]|uniref:FAD-binding domain-containing protein n=1 Tax=Cytospora schulzeri TaxID=448051 RepID=A0A423X6K3_9PEZI|nr:hypothetical protein VMCG_01186 [Valsa malicola]
MQLTTLITTTLAVAGTALALPTTPSPTRTLGKRDSTQVIEDIMPSSSSCAGRGDQCRTAAQAAPHLVKAMQDYGIGTNMEQAGILALVAYESGEMQYSKNLNNAAAGQGTSNMQMGTYNVQYAQSISALAGESITTSNVLDFVTKDEYNFGTGPWFYSTQCTDAQGQTGGSADAWFQAYMSCVGTSTSAEPDRLTYWNSAKKVKSTLIHLNLNLTSPISEANPPSSQGRNRTPSPDLKTTTMSGNDKDFRVLIAGGSIAGLSLALALEKQGIDFLVLESHAEVAPQVGASLAVLPSGFRVLDQLGCYEDVMATVNCTIDSFVIRDSDGSVLTRVADLEEHLVRRHGYPMIFFERRMLIEILYRHVRQKGKVLTSKRVVGVRQDGEGVAVECRDGSSYEGGVLIGADGLWSTVGRHIAQATGKSKEGGLPVQYRCLFGISDKVPGIGEDTLHHVTNQGSSLFAASGPNDRTYWCLFTNMGSTYYGDALPPYDEKDEAETVKQHGNDAVTETVRFRDLYERRIKSVSTPLHEGALDRWYDRRCMVVGDAAHKLNPIIGLGGMSALETSAALTNHLVALLKSSNNPSTSEIESVFAMTEDFRWPRAKELVDISMLTQQRFAMGTPWLRFMNRYYYPALGPRVALGLLSSAYTGAVSLDMNKEKKPGLPGEKDKRLPDWLPKSAVRSLPFEDELLHRPMPRSALVSGIITTLLVGLVMLGVYMLLYVGHVNGTFRLVDEAVWQGSVEIPGQGMTELKSISTAWLMAAQLFGLGLVLPLYVLAFFRSSSRTAYWMPAERFVPQSFSKAIIPALALGFLVPSMLVAASTTFTRDYAQEVVTFWQISPVLTSWVAESLSGFLATPRKGADGKKAPLEDYQGLDMAGLRRLYNALFIIASAAHTAILLVLLWTPGLSVAGAFLPTDSKRPVADIAEGGFQRSASPFNFE